MDVLKKTERIAHYRIDKRELPCKDLDLDCLPDEHGCIPFGSYRSCYLYDPDKGSCPFLPLKED